MHSRRPLNAEQQLVELLATFMELCREGRLPFAPELVENKIKELLAAGLPPCRHSAAYRGTERPAYRVVEKAVFEEMLTRRQCR
ncbi:MAG: hypothetical protein ONA69_05060 [candidate division KSB1 bacterium]|nr:hypothetical protein [candidate division KSB1 bacterium]MDZ7346147.1 hypothetical protein [candidate division KSB1 bacterium]